MGCRSIGAVASSTVQTDDERTKENSIKTELAETGVKVTPETFIRAETDGRFAGITMKAGGINKTKFFRVPTPLDDQPVMRMNRDTIYTMTIVDTSKGATITVPH